MNLTLIRNSPIEFSGFCHVVVDGKQLCGAPCPNPIDWHRDDVYTPADVCGVCVRALVKRLDMRNPTETSILKALRGDYDDYAPNKFWTSYGVTTWS